jgi:hypothetical protein
MMTVYGLRFPTAVFAGMVIAGCVALGMIYRKPSVRMVRISAPEIPQLDQHTVRTVTNPDWASRLAAAIERELAKRPGVVQLRSIRATSSEEVEVVYSDGFHPGLRGIRIGLDAIRSAPQRIRVSSVGELAFDIVTTGTHEPRPTDDFLAPDANGVSWLSLSRWFDDVG